MKRLKGDNAFPLNYSGDGDFEDGMTLRDYFAARAMSAWLAVPEAVEACDPTGDASADQMRERIAESSYAMADAMLKIRETTSKGS